MYEVFISIRESSRLTVLAKKCEIVSKKRHSAVGPRCGTIKLMLAVTYFNQIKNPLKVRISEPRRFLISIFLCCTLTMVTFKWERVAKMRHRAVGPLCGTIKLMLAVIFVNQIKNPLRFRISEPTRFLFKVLKVLHCLWQLRNGKKMQKSATGRSDRAVAPYNWC